MKKLVIICFGISFFCYSSYGQSAELNLISSAGGFFETSNHSITFTIGDTFTETFSTNNLYLTQGFLQPYLTVTNILESNADEIRIIAYPNPTQHYLYLEVEADLLSTYKISLFDLSGKLLSRQNIETKLTLLDCSAYHSGTYFIRIESENIINKTIVFQKINY